jgi:hypothetical protein
MADQMEQTMEWFELDGEVETTTVGGLPAASMGTQLAMQLADGTVVEVTSRSHLIPRGRALFIVGLSRPIDDEAAGGELQRVLDSIQIDP